MSWRCWLQTKDSALLRDSPSTMSSFPPTARRGRLSSRGWILSGCSSSMRSVDTGFHADSGYGSGRAGGLSRLGAFAAQTGTCRTAGCVGAGAAVRHRERAGGRFPMPAAAYRAADGKSVTVEFENGRGADGRRSRSGGQSRHGGRGAFGRRLRLPHARACDRDKPVRRDGRDSGECPDVSHVSYAFFRVVTPENATPRRQQSACLRFHSHWTSLQRDTAFPTTQR